MIRSRSVRQPALAGSERGPRANPGLMAAGPPAYVPARSPAGSRRQARRACRGRAVAAVSYRRKLRQGNGSRLTRDRAAWTHKTRLGGGSRTFRPAGSRNRAAEREQLGSISARSRSGGVQAVQDGLALWCNPGLLETVGREPR